MSVMMPVAISSHAIRFERAKPGLSVIFKKIPKAKIAMASSIPNIVLIKAIFKVIHADHLYFACLESQQFLVTSH